ncbi:MAG: PfkB family carbohydrate kinase [Saprospiraceae bacterium]|nr:PfkB family carbohydrate kinase [Saprospiraceae bacterium]
MTKRKIAILGPIPRDTIITYQGDKIKNYGCITHPAVALSKLEESHLEIIPVAHVRKNDEAPIKEMLQPYSQINLEHITSDQDRGNVIRLEYVDQNKRMEKQLGMMNPIVPEDIKDLMDCEAFVFLPISDFEITLETLQFIKKNSKGIIIFDAHGPTNGVATNGTRFHKFWVDMKAWLPYIDILKMNLEESQCCYVKPEYSLDELAKEQKLDTNHLPDLAEECLNAGLKTLIITVDADGCLIFTKEEGKIKQTKVPSMKMESVVDTTGCGDTFAGGLAYGLLNNSGDLIVASKYANALAARRTQGKTFDVFKTIQETEKMMIEYYGSI